MSPSDRPRYGVLTFQAVPFDALVDDAVLVERLGFDNLWLADHFAFRSSPQVSLLEGWTTLAALAMRVGHIRIGHAITNASVRNPGVLCRQALTLDQISEGRLEVGIGAGAFESERKMLGIDSLDPAGRADRLDEVARVLDTGLRGENVTLDGRFWQLNDMPMRPVPTQRPRPPLWIAAQGPRSLRTTARYADVLVLLGEEGLTRAQLESRVRSMVARVSELRSELAADRGKLRICYLAGWPDAERPFDSEAAFADFVGRYGDAGVTDFAFFLYNPAEPTYASSVGQWADRRGLEMAAEQIRRAGKTSLPA